MLDVSDHERSIGDEPDAPLEVDEVGWISGQNGEDDLSLILVERDTSHGLSASKENIHTVHDPVHPSKEKVANDDIYRLKGYEASIDAADVGPPTPLIWLRYRLFPWLRRAFMRYCYPEFNDPQVETTYADRTYDSQKVRAETLINLTVFTDTPSGQFLAFVCSTWLVLSWVIALTLLPNSRTPVSDIIFYYCIAPALTVPLPLMIFYDFPKRLPVIYQIYVLLSVWSWS